MHIILSKYSQAEARVEIKPAIKPHCQEERERERERYSQIERSCHSGQSWHSQRLQGIKHVRLCVSGRLGFHTG